MGTYFSVGFAFIVKFDVSQLEFEIERIHRA